MSITQRSLQLLKAKLDRRKKIHAKAVELGLKAAGLYVQRESMLRVPVEYGVLRATAATRAEGSGLDTEVIVSYGTEYAVYVHENMEMVLEGEDRPSGIGEYWDGTHGKGRSKFLESVYREKQKEIRQVANDVATDYIKRRS